MSHYLIPALAGAALICMVAYESRQNGETPVAPTEVAQEIGSAAGDPMIGAPRDPASFVAICEAGVAGLAPHALARFDLPARTNAREYCDCVRIIHPLVAIDSPSNWRRKNFPIAMDHLLAAANAKTSVAALASRKGAASPRAEVAILEETMQVCQQRLYATGSN